MNHTPSARILIVEDDPILAEGMAENLRAEGHQVEVTGDGDAGLARINAGGLDLVLLDVMLPGIDGFEVCERARAAGCEVPLLFITARGTVDDRIRGLEVGGDDYLAKPFNLQELLLRVAAILRRRGWYEQTRQQGDVVSFGGNRFDFRTFTGKGWDGRELNLTVKEAMILKALAEREGQVVSREEILNRVWGYDVFPSTRTIDNFIVRLRRSFERDAEEPCHFHTVRGIGYRFTSDPEMPS